MKTLSLIVLVLSWTLSLKAQSGYVAVTEQRLSSLNEYSTGSIGKTLYWNDSASFFYSGTRHSTFRYTSYNNGSLFGFGYLPTSIPRMIEFGANNIDSIQFPGFGFDTMVELGRNATNSFDTTGVATCTYTSGGYPVFHLYNSYNYGAYAGGKQSILVYQSGLLVKCYGIDLKWQSTWDTTFVRYLKYNGSGQLISDSVIKEDRNGQLSPSTRILYTYNVAGLYTRKLLQQYVASTSSFRDTNAYSYTYYPNRQVKTKTTEYIAQGSSFLSPLAMDSFGYTAGVPGYTYVGYYNVDASGVLVKGGYDRATHFNAKFSLTDSFTSYAYLNGVPVTGGSIKHVHDTNGNRIRSMRYRYNNVPRWTMDSTNYFYENYQAIDSTLGVIALKTVAVTISPNPTSEYITLYLPESKYGSPVTIIITNTSGQLVQVESFPLISNSRRVLLGSQVLPGVYYVSVDDHSGKRQFTTHILKL